MKRTFALLLCLFLALSAAGTPAEAFSPPTAVSNVTYQYNSRVRLCDLSAAEPAAGGLRIPGTSFAAGDIVVDEASGKSLKILKADADGGYLVTRPTIYELFSELTIPRQIIVPTAANITEYGVKGIPVKEYAALLDGRSGGGQKLMSGSVPSADMQKMYQLFESRGSKIYRYNGDYVFSSFNLGSGQSMVKLHLEGALGVSPGIVADYSLFHGYEFGFVDAAQFIDLKALLDVKITQEMYCPVFSVEVPIPKLGAVRVGIYLVLNVDGDITLTVKAEEGTIASASVYGSTKFGIPTSFHINKGFDSFSGAECDPMGYIHAGVYVTPLVQLEILDVDVFDAQLRLGFYAYADFTETTMNYGVDAVVHAFVTILDDRTTLLEYHLPILERSKTMREQDEVVFYFSRLCSYQNKINIAAFMKRPAGSAEPYADPFSDKLPFANRSLEIWYYAAGSDPQGGANQNPTAKYTVTTDADGCAGVDFGTWKVDVSKGDSIIVKAPGFNSQTDVIGASSPFVTGEAFQGAANMQGDYFEDTVDFQTLSGKDLTALDVPNAEVQFDTHKRIWYEGPVTVYSTDKATHATEKAVFTAKKDVTRYALQKPGLNIASLSAYDVKPNCELRWQVNDSGYVYGTLTPSGAGGLTTRHNIFVRRLTVDQEVPITDYEGRAIGVQHNITLQLLAVNKGGSRAYTGTAALYAALGEVPPDYVQGPFPPRDLGYVKFPAADVRYPNHFEYYPDAPFPVLLCEAKNIPPLTLGGAVSSSEGTSTQAAYRWRWEELKPDIPATVTVTREYTVQSPTGAPSTVYERIEAPNIIYQVPSDMDLGAFAGVKTAVRVLSETAGAGEPVSEADAASRSVYQMRHIVSGMSVTGVPLADPPFSPPAPLIYNLDELTPGMTDSFNIEFQLEQMMKTDRFVVNPMGDWAAGAYKSSALTARNTAVKAAVTIRNAAALPAWAAGYIRASVNNGIMSLDAGGNFPAGKKTTRREFCTAIVNALGLSGLDTVRTGFPFTDVKANSQGFRQMQTAYQCGIINGVSDTGFSPDAPILRQEAAAMLIRAFDLRNSGLIPADAAGGLSRFSDRGSVSGYAVNSLEASVAMGFFSGYPDGTLLPQANITNEQTAKIVWELKLKAEKPGLQWG